MSAYPSAASPSVCEKDTPAPGTVVVEDQGGEIGFPCRKVEGAGHQGTLARRPVAGQGEPVVEQRFDAEHVLSFDLAAPSGRVLRSIESDGIESNVQRIHAEGPTVDDVAPSGEQEVFRAGGVLGVEFVHVEPHTAAIARGGMGEWTADGRHGHGPVPPLQPHDSGRGQEAGVAADSLRFGHEPRRIVTAGMCPQVDRTVQRPTPWIRAGDGRGDGRDSRNGRRGHGWPRFGWPAWRRSTGELSVHRSEERIRELVRMLEPRRNADGTAVNGSGAWFEVFQSGDGGLTRAGGSGRSSVTSGV